MIKGSKICGISDTKTLNYIINHQYPPQFIGFICNYSKSKRYVEFDKLVKLIDVDKKNISFVAVLVNPNDFEGAAQALLDLEKDAVLFKEKSNAGILRAGDFSWDKSAEKFSSIITDLLRS